MGKSPRSSIFRNFFKPHYILEHPNQGGGWPSSGANICQPHVCACGALVTARGTHGLSCSLGFGRVARHAAINDLIHRSLIKAGFPAVKEPRGMLRSDGKRPDGTTLIPWRAGRNLVWDATVVDTLAPSYLQATAVRAGAPAEIADSRKNKNTSSF